MAGPPPPPTAALPRAVQVGYGLGSIATGTFGTVPGLILLYYLTDVLSVSAGIAALVVFLPKAWDVLLNPWIGSLSDRTRSAMGPRRPWLLAGALTLPVTFAAIFMAPSLSGTAAALYVAVAFLLAATAFAVFQVPYVAMPAEMTGDTAERSLLMSWRIAFLGVAILLSGGLAPAIAQGQDDAATGYRLMGLAVAGLLLVGTLAAFLGTRRAPRAVRTDAEGSLRAQIAVARTNRPFLLLFGAFVLQAVPAGIMLAGAPYLAGYLLGSPAAVTPLFVCLVGPLVLTMPLWLRAARRYGKRSCLLAAAALFLAGALALVAVPLLPPTLAAPYSFACVAVVGVGYAGTQMLPFAMLTDVIALDAAVSGKRRAGIFTGLWTAGETLAMAAGAGAYALVLEFSGFIPSDATSDVAQPAGALWGIVAGMSVLPALLIALSFVFVRRYDVTEARLDAMLADPESFTWNNRSA
ncbi:GPH family glycoside/pentoside/hexuronide:cation symporter [Murinocardiopsis flavida]|uniref:GPH family glycoside/pentoside/hexuronide:cation symporter n=1 Tax=Murinocardiopsis flavida TaxID=645275 RepID=A0A2P8DDX6_9ACTN|nr:MFS transporter [Murinocardiopsis flavida]PSK95434.1 GPH family glycoside/pentoside/hexuronide:cation symporter [Murinocardiopsis flavida]